MDDNQASAAGTKSRPDLSGHRRCDWPGDRRGPAQARRPAADPACPRAPARRHADDGDAGVRRSAAPWTAERRGWTRHVRAAERARHRGPGAGGARSRRQRADAASLYGRARGSACGGSAAIGGRADFWLSASCGRPSQPGRRIGVDRLDGPRGADRSHRRDRRRTARHSAVADGAREAGRRDPRRRVHLSRNHRPRGPSAFAAADGCARSRGHRAGVARRGVPHRQAQRRSTASRRFRIRRRRSCPSSGVRRSRRSPSSTG